MSMSTREALEIMHGVCAVHEAARKLRDVLEVAAAAERRVAEAKTELAAREAEIVSHTAPRDALARAATPVTP